MGLFGSKKKKTTRGASFFDRENLVHTIADLQNILNLSVNQTIITEKLIRFNNFVLNEINENLLIDQFGEPDEIIDNLPDLKNYKVYFYRHSMGKLNFLMQFHFCGNTFLFVNNIVKSSYVLDNDDKKSILNRIQKKYFPDVHFNIETDLNIKIVDSDENFLYSKDMVNFSITYINNTPFFKELINKNDSLSSSSPDSKIDDYF